LGNHLLADAKGLIFAGLFFAGPEAEEWLAKGESLFFQQIGEQVLADGGHFERSPMYHAQVLEDVLDVANALNRGTEPLFPLMGRMHRWLEVMTHPDEEIALFNDAAFGDAAAPGCLAAYTADLSPGNKPSKADLLDEATDSGPLISRLADTGYVRVDCGDMTAFLDVAPIGPDYLPGHAHADTLTFELSIGWQRVVVDSGVSRYGEGAERLRQRGTAAHNTVMIDDQDSSEVWGGFRVARRAYPQDLEIREAEGLVACSHDGYRRLPGKPVHRREWRFFADGLRIRDTIEGEFREASGRLHFHPGVDVLPLSEMCESGEIILPDGRRLHWKIARGHGRLLDTTWHPEFGLSIPNRCLEVDFAGRETEVELLW